jgi:hypothetical protein
MIIVILPGAITITVILLSVIMPNAILICVILHSVILLSVFCYMLSLCLCRTAECHSTLSFC